MIRKPNFFIIGAPKCGTTSLAEYLRSHKQVFFSNPKEPEHFNKKIMSDEAYLTKYFSQASNEKAIGEGSTHYLHSQDAVKNILAFNPDAKFIVMIRNPIDMAESLYYEERSQLVENAKTFEEAWRNQKVDYQSICKTGEQIERLLATVNKSKVLIIAFNEFTSKPQETYLEVLNFLGLDDDHKAVFENAHPRLEIRSGFVESMLHGINNSSLKPWSLKVKNFLGITHWPLLGKIVNWVRIMNLKTSAKHSLDPVFRQELWNYFKSDVDLTYKLTGINLYENN